MLWSDLLILLPSLIGFWILVSSRKRDPQARVVEDALPPHAIVVDGSNVMHWGDGPSADVLTRVLRALERKGHNPIVFFDANVGYVLGDRYFNERVLSDMLGMPEQQICVVSKGVIADEAILMFASDHGLRVVSNDRYRDWRVRFPHADTKGVLLGGAWRDGSVVWRGQL